ncbi:MAG: hypothetical protein Q8M08_14605 [Bacteroidales bacterium]|nr:hypothetical protein [Bacteroidales bacterium]
MKNLMKIFAAVTIVMAFSMGTMAQSNVSKDVSLSAEVFQVITLDKQVDLNFGRVAPNMNKTIDLTNEASGGQVGEGTETVGRFLLSASAGSNVELTFTSLPATLLHTDATTTMDVNYVKDYADAALLLAGYANNTSFTTATQRFDPNSSFNVATGNFPTNVVESVNGIYVFLGGTVQPVIDQKAGVYSGTATLKAEYN